MFRVMLLLNNFVQAYLECSYLLVLLSIYISLLYYGLERTPLLFSLTRASKKKSRTQDHYFVGNTPKEAKKATDFEYSSTLILQYFITIMKLRKQQKVVARFRILFRAIQL